MAATLADLLEKTEAYLPTEKAARVEEAYRFAEQAHDGQVRKSGSPYIQHPLEVALLLAEIRLDSHTIIGALLHDVLEDCPVAPGDLEQRFGLDVLKLVEGVTKLTKLEDQTTQTDLGSWDGGKAPLLHAASLRKMLVAMAEDVRVILIKLADRLHNMRTIRALPPRKRLVISRETLDVYAPLSNRLGIGNFGWQLEDLAFRCLHQEEYREISRLLAASRSHRETFIHQVVQTLRKETRVARIKADISGRPKHFYSIYQKMQRYAAQGRDFHKIYDLFGFRVLVDDIADCYSVLGTVHSLWRPIPGEFDDYIANPRENMYQSLHTVVMGPGSQPFEVQIRTSRMHEVAEYGVAAHFRYKEGGHGGDHRFDEQMSWMRQLLEWNQDEPGTEQFIESVKTDIFPDQVFVYTPKGQVRELPMGATPIDFAYRIHTELGHGCRGAKINGKLVALDSPLRNGDTVEILVSKTEKGPSLDWLNADLGFVKTANARDKIRAWFRRRARAENIAQGRVLLEKELRRLHIGIADEGVAALLGYDSTDDLLTALGSGATSTLQLAPKLLADTVPAPPLEAPPDTGALPAVMVNGMPNMLTRLGQCCHPLAGDPIVGFVTRARGVTVHRESCRSLHHLTEAERRIAVSWGVPTRPYPAKVAIEAWDRLGLLRDITTVLSSENVNIAAVRSTHHKRGTVVELLTVETSGATQLSRILSRLEQVKAVIRVTRTG
ncbi:MAG: bifunctional (p)ppGpp synthetase/guanosine-3',5'-bis(diphosphate) 3'-pyrophosphohydrolase [Chloroflexi bacterium]|nr:bifunctional (p)ppGpp synthetase/guanosine-3',5'-bis(diphosphate) 3'-pyrophosphohydrolase [Chloroflexota bacterium]